MSVDDPESVIDEFLEGGPRAAEWRLMRETLSDRLRSAKEELQRETDPRTVLHLTAQIVGLERQIAALQQEEVVTEFVEYSVRSALARPSLEDLEDEQPG